MNTKIKIAIQKRLIMLRKNVFVSLLLAITTSALAQSEYTVDVNSAFSPTLKDAQQKINEKANIVDTVNVAKPVNYNITSPVYLTSFTPEPIKAPKVGKDQITRLYRNFLKVGVGNWSPYLDFEANSLRSTEWAYGGRLFHYSSWGKIKTYAPAGYSDTRLEGYVQKFFKNYTLNANAGYRHLLAHCYGFQPDTVFKDMDYKLDAKNIRRQYHHVNANVNYSNNNLNDNSLNQRYSINYDFLTDNTPKTYEHQLGMAVALNHDVVRTKKAFSMNVGGKLGFDYFHNRWNGIKLSDNAMADINPYVILKFEEYFVKLGFDALLHFQQQQDVKFHFYPDVEVRLAIVPRIFSFYAGLDGGMKRNSYLSLIQENPYLSNYINMGFTDEKTKIFAGIQLGISRSLSIGARGSFGFYSGMPFFINDTSQKMYIPNVDTSVCLYNTFNIVEDRTNLLNLHFDIKYQYKNQLNLVLNLDYNQYFIPSTADLLEAWYKPKFIAEFDIQYRLLEKFLFGIDFYIHTGAKYPKFINGNIAPTTMKAVFDFNFSFEYLWSKRLSFFANVNNFAYQRNYFYQDYPSQRLNVLIGAKYTFGGEAVGKK